MKPNISINSKKIIYLSSCLPLEIYNSNNSYFGDTQSQRFNYLFLKGLSANGFEVTCISFRSGNYDKNIAGLYTDKNLHVEWHIIDSNCTHYQVFKQAKSKIMNMIKQDNVIIICDILSITLGMVAANIRKHYGIKLVGIVTDLPQILYGKMSVNSFVSSRIIRMCDNYILLTSYMIDKLKIKRKKCFIMEGLSDDITYSNLSLPNKKVYMYAGTLHVEYGIKLLVDSFIRANLNGVTLIIYGIGNYVDELKKICSTNSNIVYMGLVNNKCILEKEREVTLLINPRTSNHKYVYYSFPSKIIEYMSSGTPVLMNRLPGIPNDYFDCCFTFMGETVDDYVNTLVEISKKDDDELKDMGNKARDYINKNKKYDKQIKKMIEFLDI